jgi:uncharacterized protein YajQ (UPF0234 family)
MPQDFSFDVVSKIDLQEVENAVHQANKEMSTRFDFKGSISRVEWDKKESQLTFFSDDEIKLKSVNDIVQSKLVKRGISLKSLDYKSIEGAERGTVRQVVKITQGIASEKAKTIVQSIKESKLKVQASIQGDQLRVTGRSKDDLQAVMNLLRAGDYGLPLQFNNYR